MAALPPIRKFAIEDYPTEKGWISPFLLTLNQFVTSVVDALTKSLTLSENTTSDVKTVELSSVPTSTAPVAFSWGKKIAPKAIVVGNVTPSSGSVTVTDAVFVQFRVVTATNGATSIELTNVVGIVPTSSLRYTLTLVCIAG